MNELIKDLYNQIHEHLLCNGFELTDTKYHRHRFIQSGPQVVINGQRITAQTQKQEYVIEYWGQGTISNFDDSNSQVVETYHIGVYLGGDPQFECGFALQNFQEFLNYFNQLF